MALPEIGLQAVLVLQQFEANARKYDSQLKKLEQQTEKTAKTITSSTTRADDGWAGLRQEIARNQAAMDQTAGAAAGLGLKLGLTAGAAAAVAGAVAKATAEVYRLAEASAATVDARQSFVNLATASGISADQLLGDLQRVSRGTVDSATLIQTANRALLAGGAQIANELPQLFSIAQAAARATGQDLGFVFETLVKGIIKGSPLLIDNAEVYIKAASAVDQYAASMGKTTEELTANERTMATLNAVLEQGADFVARTGGNVDAATDSFKKSDVAAKEFARGIGELAIPAVNALNDSFMGLLTGAKFWIATANALKTASYAIAAGVSPVAAFQAQFDATYKTLSGGIPTTVKAADGLDKLAETASDAADKTAALNEKLTDLATQRTGKLEDIELQHVQRMEDLAIQRGRQLEDAERALSRQREDMARQTAERLEDIERGRARQAAETVHEQAARVADFVRESNRQREDLERRHQERIAQIGQRYSDTIQEAARRNDAVAIAQAIRTQQRELRDAQQAQQTEQADLGRDLDEKRQQIARDAQEAQRREQERYQQALEDLRIAQGRQEQELQISLARQEQDRVIAWARQEQDLALAEERQMAALDRWYAEEQTKLGAHMEAMTTTAVAQVAAAGTAIAQATNTAMTAISMAAVDAARVGAIGAVGMPQITRDSQLADQWLRGSTPGGYRAEGGMDVVSQPTTFMMGEAGPEAVLSVPLSGTMNVNHRFSKLPVGFDGLPGGVNTGQVESLIWDIFSQVGKNLLQQRAQI